MYFFKKLLFILIALAFILGGLWLVVANPATVPLDLLFLTTPPANLGLVVLACFSLGAALGLLAGLNLLDILKLRSQLYWLKREVKQLQDALGDKR